MENMGRGRGCSQKDNQKKNEEIYNKNPRTCCYCGSVIPYKKRINKFCNHSCSCSYNNQGLVRNKNGHNGRTDLVLIPKNKCIRCGKLTKNIKYCSNICKELDSEYKIVKQITKTGVLPTYISGGIKKRAKRYLIDKRGRRCEKCKNDIWMGVLIPIEFHHKDGNPDNNKEENIEILCSNCHAITINHRGRNKNGNGRWSRKNKNRRQRYSQGLST